MASPDGFDITPSISTPDVFSCAACGARVEAGRLAEARFHCPNFGADDDGDHILEPVGALSTLRAAAVSGAAPIARGGSPEPPVRRNPFLRYRDRLTAWRVARERGVSDTGVAAWIEAFDEAVTRVDGQGFRETPLARHAALDQALGFGASGGVWVKDETHNVSGSHKARHLAGIMLYLEVLRRTSPAQASEAPVAPLAIASCGNAALAAAVVARAASRPLQVFVPASADRSVVARLRALAADIVVCQRGTGEVGDPCYRRFQEAVGEGALPFCCQGPDNALTVEGGQTLIWEMLDQLGLERVDRLFVQVGGGALASACVRALGSWSSPDAATMPRVHAVQTVGGFPLARAWARVARGALEQIRGRYGDGREGRAADHEVGFDRQLSAVIALGDARGDDERSVGRATEVSPALLASVAEILARSASASDVRGSLDQSAHRRGAFMWPWEREPRSAAHGILDDETYDWRRVVEGMLASGGWPVIANEEQIERANDMGRSATGIDVDHTGSAGLAGLLTLVEQGRGRSVPIVSPSERVAVIFSGVRRRS